jgi:hypothetical protein
LKSGKLALQIGDLFLLLRYLFLLLRYLFLLLRYLLFLFRNLLAEFSIFLLKEIMATGRFFAPRRPITRRAAGADMVARCSLTHALTMEQNSHHVQSFVGWGHLNCYKILHTGVMADPFGSNVAPVWNPLLSIEDQPCSNPIELRN